MKFGGSVQRETATSVGYVDNNIEADPATTKIDRRPATEWDVTTD